MIEDGLLRAGFLRAGFLADRLGDLVAKRAARRSRIGLLILKMADQARRRRDRDVAPLDDLRVTGGAAQPFAAAQLGEVRPMIEEHVPELLPPAQQTPFVTLQTRLVLDLGPGIGAVGTGDVARHHRRRLELLAQLLLGPRRDMTVDAGDIVVARQLPRFEVGVHHVAGAAERRRRRDLHDPEGQDRSQPHRH